MKKQVFTPVNDGFCGAWYPDPNGSECAVILMLGDSSEDRMAVSAAKWLHKQGCDALAMSPDKKDYGHHNYPLERFGRAIEFLKSQGCSKIGIVGASTTGMLALVAASYYPGISLTVAVSPSDFIMEGFYQDGKDGMRERPGDNESSASWQGQPLPYLPYAYRHPEYWQKIMEESKAGGDKIASRKMFRRMEQRLQEIPHKCVFEPWLYEHVTHFAFPESMLKQILPIGSALLVRFMFKAGKEHPKECRETRIDIDRRLQKAIREWQTK